MLAEPALGVVELDSIAVGLRTADVIVKEAPVALVLATPATPGRFLIVFGGEVANVSFAFRRGCEFGGAHLVDSLELSVVDPQVPAALAGPRPPERPDALGVVETRTSAAAIVAGDAAAKRAHVHVVQIVVSRGLHGKGFVTLGGAVHDIEAAVDAASGAADARGGHLSRAIIANPDDAIRAVIHRGDWGRWGDVPLY